MQTNSLKLFFFALFFLGLLGDVQVQAAKIPLRGWLHSRRRHVHVRRAQNVEVKVSGMEFLKEYVYSRHANNPERSMDTPSLDTRDMWTVTVQKDQLQSMLLQVRALEAQLVALIEAEYGTAASSGVGEVTVSSDVWALVVNGGGSPVTSVQQEATRVSIPSLTTQITAGIDSAISPRVNVIPFLPAPGVDSPVQTAAAETAAPSANPTPSPAGDTVVVNTVTAQATVQASAVTAAASAVPIGQGLSVAAVVPDAAASQAAYSSPAEAGGTEEISYYTRTTTRKSIVTAKTYITVIAHVTQTTGDPDAEATGIVDAPSTTNVMDQPAAVTIVDAPSTTNVVDQPAAVTIMAAAATTDTDGLAVYVNTNMGGLIEEEQETSTTALGGVFMEINSPSTTSEAALPQAVQRSPTTSSLSASPSDSTAANSTYVFNSQASDNIAVYFGQTAATSLDSLATQCADPSIDIVILSFVIAQLDDGIYPSINFGAACGGQTVSMVQEAPGLLSCPALSAQIKQCQSAHGKKVLLSIGGATGQIAFSDAGQASDFANILWKLFGPVGSIDAELRPFGPVVLDGFDVDNENKQPANYDTFASTLRSLYSTDTTKTYYLSSAPQCPFPDASNPLPMLLLCDFVYVQFYNNPGCEIGSDGFDASVKQWSDALQASTLSTKPRLFVGAPAFSGAGSTAYAAIGSAKGMQSIAAGVKALGIPDLGGAMFWDGSEGLLNVEDGKDIFDYAKEGLNS